MWIDTHAHLADLDNPALMQALQIARDQQVRSILNTATTLDSSRKVVTQAALDPALFAAVGISPFDVPPARNWANTLEDLARNTRVVAIGEAGLDKSNPRYPALSDQIPVLEVQIALAQRLELPLVVHSRGAETEVANRCRNAGLSKVLFHCFTGSMEQLDYVLAAGYAVSFSGIITFANAHLDEQVRATPADKLFVETDSPYLSPVPLRGTPNEPARVALVGMHAAHIRGEDPVHLAHRIDLNASQLFGLPSH